MTRNAEATRQLIIEKAIALFNTQGYRATSLSDITQATGVTKGAIYANFSNKEQVAIAAFDYAVSIVLKEIKECIHQSPTAPLKLKSILQYHQKYVDNSPIPGGCPILNSAVEADDNHPLLRIRVVRLITKIKDALRQIIHRGILEKQLRDDLDVDGFVLLYYGAIEGAIMVSRVEGDKDSFIGMSHFLSQLIDQYTMKGK